MKAPYDSPLMADFVARIDEINAIADTSPGFVWRHVGEGGYEQGGVFDEDMLVNISIWQDVPSLMAFVFDTRHRELLRDRRKWFGPMDGPSLVMWWVPEGTVLSPAECKQRLDLLRTTGPSADAFDARNLFNPDGSPADPPRPGAATSA